MPEPILGPLSKSDSTRQEPTVEHKLRGEAKRELEKQAEIEDWREATVGLDPVLVQAIKQDQVNREALAKLKAMRKAKAVQD